MFQLTARATYRADIVFACVCWLVVNCALLYAFTSVTVHTAQVAMHIGQLAIFLHE